MSSSHDFPTMFGRFTAILQEHDHLGKTMRRLRAMCAALEAEQAVLPTELSPEPLFSQLRADLTLHFGAEESPDYFGVVVDEEPSLQPQIASLKDEHATMLRAADYLRQLAEDRDRWLLLAPPTRALVAQLELHERSESTLLRGLFFAKPERRR